MHLRSPWLALLALVAASSCSVAADETRHWTVYLAADKHLDYGWCGTTTEIELRMAKLVDYYLDLAEKTDARWNLDGTIWLEVYRRQRGEEGAARLLRAIRDGRIGYAGNNRVLLWGLFDTETAVRACLGAAAVAADAGVSTRTVLVEENPGLTAGVAAVLPACGFDFLGRGIYDLRAESYQGRRAPYPLFRWRAPGGGRPLLVKWDPYAGVDTWGGYAEAHKLSVMAGEKWDGLHLKYLPDRNTPEVFAKRRQFIVDTVKRYEAFGADYPLSSILLIGTGLDNWTCSEDIHRFVEKFRTEGDPAIRLVEARYEDFFAAAEREIEEKHIELPTFTGTFGIAWEEWGAHLAGELRDYRAAARLLRLAEARYALRFLRSGAEPKTAVALGKGFDALLDFAEHDCGGLDLGHAADSVDVRAGAAGRALTVGRELSGVREAPAATAGAGATPEAADFSWRGGKVRFSPEAMGVVSLTDGAGRELIPQNGGVALGEFVHRRYAEARKFSAVLPAALPEERAARTDWWQCRRGPAGVEIVTAGSRHGFGLNTHWFFHEAQPWIDITYDLEGGWTREPQTAQFWFPLDLPDAVYRYDQPGTILKAGPVAAGGDDLPGANDTLWGAATFAAATGAHAGATLLMPDTVLVQFGRVAAQTNGLDPTRLPGAIVAMPMMNLTRADHQFMQGGRNHWRFSYRLVLTAGGDFDPVAAIREVQGFALPPFLQAPGLTPAVEGLEQLQLEFAGGPVTALKVAEDGRRVIVRCWNAGDRAEPLSLRLPPGWTGAEVCDALERPIGVVEPRDGRVSVPVEPHALVTIALRGAPPDR